MGKGRQQAEVGVRDLERERDREERARLWRRRMDRIRVSSVETGSIHLRFEPTNKESYLDLLFFIISDSVSQTQTILQFNDPN